MTICFFPTHQARVTDYLLMLFHWYPTCASKPSMFKTWFIVISERTAYPLLFCFFRNDSTNASGMHQKPGRNHIAEPTCCTLKHLTTILQWILNSGFKLPCLFGEFAFPLMDDRFTPSRLASTIPTPTSSELCHLTPSSLAPVLRMREQKASWGQSRSWRPTPSPHAICVTFLMHSRLP